MRSTYFKLTAILFTVILLSGCLFPNNELEQNKVPNEDQLELVQTAVDKYREDSDGLVPIKTKSSDTDIFEKYLVDFNLLKEKNMITSVPGNAFENGGIYQYTLITPDDDPRVKLIDLRITEEVRRVNVKLDIYRSKNTYPPFGEELENGIYSINYQALGFKDQPFVVSPYSNENLPIVMDADGKLYVDYRIDLRHALEEYEHDYAEGEDIRYILADHSPFVPAYSPPYIVEDGEPVVSEEK
ncbi:MAG TPA: hypothetical protein VK044_07200 [Virgibacillus sp.]|nr:hypothetical protein [Virgibacillus sp.]